VSDSNGLYRFPALPPGTYAVTASLSGFTPAKVDDIVVTLGKNLRVDIAMKVAAKAEEITVTGESPVIDIKSSASAKNFRHEDFELIPKGRDFTSIVKLAPGANFEERAGGIAVDGASGSENNYILDGVDTTNLQTGVRAKRVVFDVIEEVQVKSSGSSACLQPHSWRPRLRSPAQASGACSTWVCRTRSTPARCCPGRRQRARACSR
jgi:hypothetical protein